ncbi:MAG: hypothetical protein ACXU8R_21380 [Xanthobacteraceae bacterium]
MSYADLPPDRPTPPVGPPPQPRNGCLTAIMVIIGIILLLPGLCAIIFGVGSMTGSHFDSGLMPFILVGLAVGAGGIMLIRAAIRGPGP